MRTWLKEYCNVMYETRWISIVGSVVVLVSAGVESYRLYLNLSLYAGPIQGDFAEYVTKLVWMLSLVAVSFTFRSILLVVSRPQAHAQLVLGWILTVVSVVIYILPFLDLGSRGSGGFTIYDMRGVDWLALTGMGYLVFGPMRFLLTAANAWDRAQRIK